MNKKKKNHKEESVRIMSLVIKGALEESLKTLNSNKKNIKENLRTVMDCIRIVNSMGGLITEITEEKSRFSFDNWEKSDEEEE